MGVTSTPYRLEHTLLERAKVTVLGLEGSITALENEFGRGRLLKTVNAIADDHANEHVSRYRKLIHGNQWPHRDQPDVGPSQFIDLYDAAAKLYVDAAKSALRYLTEPTPSGLVEAHGLVLLSEAARGLHGKSAPDGLDERLEGAIEELVDHHLHDEDELIELCRLPAGFESAEDLMISDFQAMTMEFASLPDTASLSSLSGDSATWRFLQRHCRWRFDRFRHYWHELHASPLLDRVAVARPKTRRNELLLDLPPIAQALVDYICALNYLNLRLEPIFSFKGGPGLLHAEVFRAAENLADTPMGCQLVLQRDQLLQQYLAIPIEETESHAA